jgi:hypothetical protein
MFVFVAALAVWSFAAADAPVSRPRPDDHPEAVSIETPHGPSTDCDGRLISMAIFEPRPTVAWPGECGGSDFVTLSAVLLPHGLRADIRPPATLRCEMAEALVGWVREDVAPRIADDGGQLAAIQQENSYECRNRNRAAQGKVSEHAHGIAIDLRGFVLADKSVLALTDIYACKDLRTLFHDSACRRFSTVLGPGEAYHDDHVHLDIIARRGDYRICAWAVRSPLPLPANANVAPEKSQPEQALDRNIAPRPSPDRKLAE